MYGPLYNVWHKKQLHVIIKIMYWLDIINNKNHVIVRYSVMDIFVMKCKTKV